MSGYGVRRILDVTVEKLHPLFKTGTPGTPATPLGSSALFEPGEGARTFDGTEWVPMSEVDGDGVRITPEGVQYSIQHPLRAEELEPFFRRAFGSWGEPSRFMVHVSTFDSKVGVWSTPDPDPQSTLSEGFMYVSDIVEISDYEDELPAWVSRVVLSVLVMES